MAKYQLTIRKVEDNPNFKEEMEAYSKDFGYRQRNMGMEDYNRGPSPKNVEDVLICELSEEQFKKVKLEALKVFE